MPKIKDLDSFIDSASSLLNAYPTTTRLSITYSNVEKKHAKNGKVAKETKSNRATHVVSAKLYEPASGKCVKYNTFKIKELSKILAFIGPKGVNVVTKHSDEDEEESVHKTGLASIMSNCKFEDKDEEEPIKEVPGKTATESPAPASKSKKNKKKNKKK